MRNIYESSLLEGNIPRKSEMRLRIMVANTHRH